MKKTLSLLLMLAICIPGSASAEVSKDLAWEKYISSQKKMQVAYHHLVRLNWPKLKKTIEKSQELQLLHADQQSRQFYYLVENDPDRIVRDQGYRPFVDFAWTKQDEILLLLDKDYLKMQSKINDLKKQLNKTPKYNEMQDRLASLEGDRRITAIRARFRFVSEDIENLLQGAGVGEIRDIDFDE